MHQTVQLPKLTMRREAHLVNFMYKYRNDTKYVNKRNVRTRLHDPPVFITKKTNNEKYKQNVFYYGAVKWNDMPINVRNIETYDKFKSVQKRWSINNIYDVD